MLTLLATWLPYNPLKAPKWSIGTNTVTLTTVNLYYRVVPGVRLTVLYVSAVRLTESMASS